MNKSRLASDPKDKTKLNGNKENRKNNDKKEENKDENEEEEDENKRKKWITPRELVEMLSRGVHKVLIVDARAQREFDAAHMNLNLMLNDRHKRSLVDYMSLPAECVRPVSWSIVDALKSAAGLDASRQLFAARATYDYLVLFDADSRIEHVSLPESNAKLAMLKRAVFDFDQDSPLRNEPLILQGGWAEWLLYYPVLVSSSSSSPLLPSPSSSISSGLADAGSKKKSGVENKLFEIDYPDWSEDLSANTKKIAADAQAQATVNSVKPAATATVTAPPTVQPQKPAVPPNNSLSSSSSMGLEILSLSSDEDEQDVANDEPTTQRNVEIRVVSNEAAASANSTNGSARPPPLVNRSNKPSTGKLNLLSKCMID